MLVFVGTFTLVDLPQISGKLGLQAANGRRAHHRCSVDGCPCLIDFSRADASLIAFSGSETSISFFDKCS
jgi:hypothetical protein